MRKNIMFTSLFGLALLGLLSCSGGGDKNSDPTPTPPSYATSLNYTNPTGTGYRFVRGSDSTASKLILELLGPASDTGRGISFGLTVDGAKARFVKVASTDPEDAQHGTFELGSAPQLFKAVTEGNTLRASIAQKGRGNAKALDGVLAKVAIQLQPNVAQGAIAFSATNDAKALPGANGESVPITIAVGSLVAQ